MSDPTDDELKLHEATIRIIRRTPGAKSLDDVQRVTGRPWGEMLAEESGLPREVVRRITGG